MKKGLTIGELLVTMAIIGVIATLVLPGFIKDYHKSLYVTKLKKVTELMETAINQACIDNNVSFFQQTPYTALSIAADGSTNGPQQAFLDKYFKTVPTTSSPFASKYTTLKTGEVLDYSFADNNQIAKVKLAGGEAISLMCGENATEEVSRKSNCIFAVDINGPDAPNVTGRDLFAIVVDGRTNELTEGHSSAKCGELRFGYGCYKKILEDNWEMKY